MSFLEICVLAVIQGLTEFLPVSSSGHLVLLQHFSGMQPDAGPALELALHGGTLLSILLFYRRRLLELISGLRRREKTAINYSFCLIISCIPAAVLYLLFDDQIDAMFGKPMFWSLMLIITGVLLLSTMLIPRLSKETATGWRQALIIGVVQALALLPGISRSGSTITGARWLGIRPQKAAEFSFLMSVPLLIGGILLKSKEILSFFDNFGEALALLTGCAIAGVVGFLALKILALFQMAGKFWCFGCYCILLGSATLVFMILK